MAAHEQAFWPHSNPDSLQEICLQFCASHLKVLAEHCTETDFDYLCLRHGVTLPTNLCEGLLKAYASRHGNIVDNSFLHIFEDVERTQLKCIRVPSADITDEAVRILSRHPVVELDLSGCTTLSELCIDYINSMRKTLRILRLEDNCDMFRSINLNPDMDMSTYADESPPESCTVRLVAASACYCDLDLDLNQHEGKDQHRICHALSSANRYHHRAWSGVRARRDGNHSNEIQDHVHVENVKMLGRDYVFDTPNLKVLCLRDIRFYKDGHSLMVAILNPLSRLTHLDLTKCINIQLEYMDCLENCSHLVSLVLADIEITELKRVVQHICQLKSLRHLDLSQSSERPTMYNDPEINLKYLVDMLDNLSSLEISGTNLAGLEPDRGVQHRLSMKTEEMKTAQREPRCSIPGLENKRLEFLGLMDCADDACSRPSIPANKVTGNESEEQVLLSLQVYLDRAELLTKALNNLFQLFRFSVVRLQHRALLGILAGMRRHRKDRHVQISGSASLFYIVKGDECEYINIKLKRQIIEVLLDGMNNHISEKTMCRNGCLTLCHLKIPDDVLFCHDRLVSTLLKMFEYDFDDQDQFVTRSGIYLLNLLVCQVDGKEKQLVGDMGAIETMLTIIKKKLILGVCDEIMEVAWSTMWNVTDETARNCERFLSSDGMGLFVQCLRKFPSKDELLRNMMGLMGNVAEVKELRPKLMMPLYINIFSDLLDSESDGIEVSYNAAGVLAHIASDGPEAWKESLPLRVDVLCRLTMAIERWNINSNRNINYRSFEPILRLVSIYNAPEAQHWALWALCNLTKVYSEKYCDLLEKEGGLVILEKVLQQCHDYQPVLRLANQILETHRKWRAGTLSPNVHHFPQLEGRGDNFHHRGHDSDDDADARDDDNDDNEGNELQ